MASKKPAAAKKRAAPKRAPVPRPIYAKTPAARAPAKKAAEKSFGKKLGGVVGHGVQQIIKNITGFGDYHIQGNSLMEGGMTPPQVVNSADRGGVIVRHREYIADISATTAFTNQTFQINPGLFLTFPWLAQVADSFEEYSMRGLVFEFKSLSSDAVLSSATSSALGSVMMATQYNSLLPQFADKQTMLNYEFANSSKPSCSFYHPVECKKNLTPVSELYIRTDPVVPVGADIRLYDMGRFEIATVGMQAASGVCGELWATYEIELYKAKSVPLTKQALTDHLQISNFSNVAPLGTTSAFAASSSLGGTSGATTYTFPSRISRGKWIFVLNLQGTVAALISQPAITTSGCSLLTLWYGDSVAQVSAPQAGASSQRYMVAFIVQVTQPSASVTFGAAGTLPTGPLNSDMIVTLIDEDLVSITPEVVKETVKNIRFYDDDTSTSLDDDEYVKVKKSDIKKLM